MVKKLLIPISVLLVLGSSSCSKDPVDDVLKTPVVVTKPIQQVIEPETNESLSESDKPGNWISQMQGQNGLLRSSEHIDFVSLYDNALAAIWYTSQQQFSNTEKILD